MDFLQSLKTEYGRSNSRYNKGGESGGDPEGFPARSPGSVQEKILIRLEADESFYRRGGGFKIQGIVIVSGGAEKAVHQL